MRRPRCKSSHIEERASGSIFIVRPSTTSNRASGSRSNDAARPIGTGVGGDHRTTGAGGDEVGHRARRRQGHRRLEGERFDELVVASAFGVFNPAVVVPAVDAGWALTDATTICAARTRGATAQLVRILGPEPDGLVEFGPVAADPDHPDGRPAGLRRPYVPSRRTHRSCPCS